MRTQRELYSEKKVVYESKWDECPACGGALARIYTSGWKTVQTMSEVMTLAQRPKWCVNVKCEERHKPIKSAHWQQIAPIYCTYGYDVIVQIGWQRQAQRQTFDEIYLDLRSRIRISESQVRSLYTDRYLSNGRKWNG